ncbi:MAG: hypothetical protein AB7O43_15820 [Hyphomicrobiaceae bacterium]
MLKSIGKPSCKGSHEKPNSTNVTSDVSSKSAYALATIAAATLVISSAGFGALFGYRVGIEHGAIMAGLSVGFAIALDICKPIALAGALQLIFRLDIIRGAALALLAIVAIAYSLTAELSLMAGARGDLAAQRQAEASSATAADHKRQRIEADLKALGTTRPSGEIQAELTAAISRDKRLTECDAWQPSKWARTICVEQVAPLKAELAKAERREGLERELSTLATGKPTAAVQADPGAEALHAYLGALGFVVPVAALSKWLVLVPVIALELGSSLSVLLVKSLAPPARCAAPQPAVRTDEAEQAKEPTIAASEPYVRPAPEPLELIADNSGAIVKRSRRPRALGSNGRTDRSAVEGAIVETLQRSGGKLPASVRTLAQRVAASKTTTHSALVALLASGAVVQVGSDLALRTAA